MSTSNGEKRKIEQIDEDSPEPIKRTRTEDGHWDLDSLIQLLDFSSTTNETDISSKASDLATALLHNYVLSLSADGAETTFEILELEFYLQKPGVHEDPFTHGSEEQKQSGRWYFHRAPRRSADSSKSATASAGYRGGTRKGLDLTLGGPLTSPHFSNPSAEKRGLFLHGGALLRTLRRVSDSQVISGPSLLVDKVLRLSGACSISDLVENQWGGDISAFSAPSINRASSLRILPRRTLTRGTRPTVYRSPRIGLDLSHPGTTALATHPRVNYIPKPYRYFTHPHLLTSNGRTQTFLGVYRLCTDSGRFTGKGDMLLRELAVLSGIKDQTVARYLADYRSGYDAGILRTFIGAAGKGASGSPSTYLRMMGTVDRVHDNYRKSRDAG